MLARCEEPFDPSFSHNFDSRKDDGTTR